MSTVEEDLRKLLGRRRPGYKPVPDRQRQLGSAGTCKIPYGGDLPDSSPCMDIYSLLHFNDDTGEPSINMARVIEGLFEVHSGRQVRVFLDPDANVCDDVMHASPYTWYKLQLKNQYRATLKRTISDYDAPLNTAHWWPPLDVLTAPLAGGQMSILRADYGMATLEGTVYKMLTQNELKAPAFFSTVPLSSGLLKKSPERYKQAVEEINNYFCGYLTEANHYNDSAWAELYFRYNNQTELEISSTDDKATQILNFTERRVGKKIPHRDEVEQYYKWTCASAPLIYCTVTNWTLDADEAYWGIAPEQTGSYDSRWKCADDLTIGVDLISDYALKKAGLNSIDDVNAGNAPQVKFADHFIHCFEDSDGVQQFIGGKDISLYWRDKYDEDGNPTTDKDYQLFTTVKGDGITHLWSLDIYPDSSIIDLRYSIADGLFIPNHPHGDDFLPPQLPLANKLELQDAAGNRYSLTADNTGFVLISERLSGRRWKILRDDYQLIS
ncbi:hypothetical protein BGI15_03150 [Snodgrassella alvi]|uniref:hypothetical protein n=1 Tax=Snodgrassella alvi TaxID=1196083 RepID=UPI000A057FB5|nr:hypothetical protein [Snodgrassella alvi]ORF23810.1 hypothetical protein BGI07_09885 [Snodgrassella alvi]ORF29403.1 hypothetical protein BGI10_10655 [Snodgrassella alvi]ORF33615.1 hypothetical protein BGI11_08155 [Snodgrassella alvi]ORF37917.1 hypothetical protein BGI13_06630 [Snodgrassella alvi]ORF38197.1 hypothetical protein BGI14_09770 [Snodgrassella alvi]